MTDARDLAFDCRFLWSMDDVAGSEPYTVFTDELSDPFGAYLFEALRGKEAKLGATDRVESLSGDAPVFMEAPVWIRNWERLRAAGVHGERARVLLYFDADPTGCWDFAKACGRQLERVFRTRRLDREALLELQPYIEKWMGGRVVGDRLLPMPAFTVRDYADLVHRNMSTISRVMGALADDESRATYARILFGSNEEVLAGFVDRVFGPQQYMDIVRLKPGDVVVNCGVAEGWEIPYFLCKTEGRGRILNFDPNIAWKDTSYRGFIETFQDCLEEHAIVLGAEDGVVEMPSASANMVRSDEVGQAMVHQGAPTTQYVSRRLDSLVAEGLIDRIDYLKMDVEGGERYVLKGAEQSIVRFRPKLAVAIYHEPQHFWEYPELLLDMLSGYRFYLRQYGYSRFETLLYCVPDEDEESRSGQEGLQAHIAPSGASLPTFDVHLRDRAPRGYYAGERRLMNRLVGRRWSDAEILPEPLIDTDDVVAAFDDAGGTLFVARHQAGPGEVSVVVGRSTGPPHLDWVASQGVAGDTVCVPAPGPWGEPGYGLYDPGQGRLWVYALETGVPVGLAGLACTAPPFLVERENDGYAVFHARPEGGFTLQTFGSDATETGPHQVVQLPFSIAGAGSARFHHARGWSRCLFGQLDGSAPVQAVDGLGHSLGSLDWDERFELVPGFRIGATGLARTASS